MKFHFSLLLPLVLISCESDNTNMDDFETAICDCAYSKFDSLGIDLKAELNEFEDYLVTSSQLKDRSGQSYYEIYRSIAQDDQIPITSDYESTSLTPEVFPLYTDCFYMCKDDPELTAENSKMRLIYSAFDSISAKGTVSPSIVAAAIIDILNPSDFEKDVYKTHALLTWYFIIPEDDRIYEKLPAHD